ncbi:Na/Pi cotransporter family protein [Lacrimispora sp. NSJ-141]|uniref:Na/Pi cotransporter family protein n=1 Tax=Lientehia hominis TaxID=2897778 RepID=A0AAP2RKP7_9FIRM|nr:Na/Pi cotransporter family protein [Lientehia hominis]MCD2493218.1 Na/Pi cotransporter family protein [Lientehia hominis]
MSLSDVKLLFQFVGGLGMFLYGMNIMADGLQKAAGGRMKRMLGYITNNRLLGVLLGALITAIIQSSSATTVMVVGFVNAGILSLSQAVGVIMGANIGTTVTAWLVSMSEWGEVMKPEFFAPVLIGIGAFMLLFAKKERQKEIGTILVGFGVLFIGLSFMSGSIEPYKDAPVFAQIFTVLGSNPIFGILAGVVVTGIIQSSSASVGILQTLAMNGVVTWNSAVYITLGQNIGTCVTALLASAGAHKTAKRAAVIHLMFNVMGAVLFGIVMFIVFSLNGNWAASTINSTQISVFHTIFNVTNTLIMFPFAGRLVSLSGKIVREKVQEPEETLEQQIMSHLDTRILENPSFAIETAKREVVRMGELSLDNVKLGEDAVLTNNQESVDRIFAQEKTINFMEKALTEYLVKISNLSLMEEQSEQVKNLLYTVNDLERIGDHAENIAELAESKIQGDIQFSPMGQKDLETIFSYAVGSVENAVSARRNEDAESIRQVIKFEDLVDSTEEDLRDKHIARLANNECRASHGVIFLDIMGNLERVSDHAYNIAGYVKDEM